MNRRELAKDGGALTVRDREHGLRTGERRDGLWQPLEQSEQLCKTQLLNPPRRQHHRRSMGAASLAAADASALEAILRPLGLHRKRSVAVIAFSEAFLRGEWRAPEELPGIGRYASDAHRIFCEGRWRDAQPHDHALRWYVEWMRTTCE